MNKVLRIGLGALYFVLEKLTLKLRVSFLIQLKISIGLALIGSNQVQAQTIHFPNNENKSDTLTLDVELEESQMIMCYDPVIDEDDFIKPEFEGGKKALKRFFHDHVQYPDTALDNAIEGDVEVYVTVDTNGVIVSAVLIKDIGYGLGQEALRLVKMFPKMIPGQAYGKEIRMGTFIVFHFELPKK